MSKEDKESNEGYAFAADVIYGESRQENKGKFNKVKIPIEKSESDYVIEDINMQIDKANKDIVMLKRVLNDTHKRLTYLAKLKDDFLEKEADK